MIQIGIHTDNYRPLSVGFEGACQKIAATGLKHLEFAAIHGQNFITALGYDPGVSLQSNPRALRRFLDKLGLRVSQIDGAYPMMGPNGSAYGVQYVTQSIRFAAELDCPMVDTVDGAFEIPGFTRKEIFRITCDNYRQCLSWAEDYKVVINVEPHGPYTNDIEFMQNLFKHFESEYLRCNFDTGNSFIAGHNPLDYLKALRKYVSHCHIKDVSPALAAAVRGEETGIGSSEVPVGGGVNADNIRACMAYLHQHHWDGVVSLECSGTDENTRKSVGWMRAVVKGLGKKWGSVKAGAWVSGREGGLKRAQRMADKEFRDEQWQQRYAPHVLQINNLVDELKKTRSRRVPYVAPMYGGKDARLLSVLRDPGSKTNKAKGGSGFLSMENVDQTAKAIRSLFEGADINAKEVVPWNIYPWYINRAPKAAELDAGIEPLKRIVDMLPLLRVVMLHGGSAKAGWDRFALKHGDYITARDLHIIKTYHPSRQALRHRARSEREARKQHLKQSFDEAARVLKPPCVSPRF